VSRCCSVVGGRGALGQKSVGQLPPKPPSTTWWPPTSTDAAPWTLVAGEDKKFARIQILKTLCAQLEEVL